jgi:hypothetical protein
LCFWWMILTTGWIVCKTLLRSAEWGPSCATFCLWFQGCCVWWHYGAKLTSIC